MTRQRENGESIASVGRRVVTLTENGERAVTQTETTANGRERVMLLRHERLV